MSERTRKTPAQIAEERLGVAERLVKNLTKKRDWSARTLREVNMQLTEATRRRDFLAQDPALSPVDGVDPAPIGPCPECAAGKHQNCTHEVPVPDGETADDMAPCPCEEKGHPEA